jgi:hypothetical protein
VFDSSIITCAIAKRSLVSNWISVIESNKRLSGIRESFKLNSFIISVDRESSNSSPCCKVSIIVVTQYLNILSNIKSRQFWINLPIKVICVNVSWGIGRLLCNGDLCIRLTITIVILINFNFRWLWSSKVTNLNLESQEAKDFVAWPPCLSISSISCISNERWKSIFCLLNVLFLDKCLRVFLSTYGRICRYVWH